MQALTNFGTAVSDDAVANLAALVHQHPILAPAAVDQSFAKAAAADPAYDASATQILTQIGLGLQAYERDREEFSSAVGQLAAGPAGVTSTGE
jgi:hypothetical protein